jgi:hypothetical protein
MAKKAASDEEKEEKPVAKKEKSMSKAEMEKALVDNFINLQKVLTNLSVKFEDLSTNISRLLQLFEISAKNFAEKNADKYETPAKADQDFIEKLDALLDQNKLISRGITLMEERMRERTGMPGRDPRQLSPPSSHEEEIEQSFAQMRPSRPQPSAPPRGQPARPARPARPPVPGRPLPRQ